MAWACHYVSSGPVRESHRTPAVSVFAAIRTAIQASHPWIPAQFLLTSANQAGASSPSANTGIEERKIHSRALPGI